MRSWPLFAVASICLVLAPVLKSQITVWNPASGNWSSSGNWGSGVPGSTSNAEFDTTSTTSTVDGAFSIGSVSVETGPLTLNSSGGSLAITGTFTNAGASAANVNVPISGTGGIFQETGVLTIGAPLTISGTTIVQGGTLVDGGAGVYSQSSVLEVASPGVIDVDFSETAGGLNDYSGGNGSVVIANGAALSLTGAVSTTFSGVISGAGSLVMNGPGTLTLTGSNTYTGSTQINSGGAITIGNGGSTGALASSVSGAGTLGFNPGSTFTFTYAGTMSGMLNVAQQGFGTTLLTGPNTNSGSITVNHGTLEAGANNAFGSGGVTINNSGVLDVHGFTANVGSLSSASATSQVALGSSGTLILTDPNANTTYAGTISGSGVFQMNAGTLMLNGASTYSGTTNIDSGATLVANNTSGSAAGTSAITVGTGGTLQIGNLSASGSVSGAVTDDGQVTVARSDAFTLANAISGIGTVEYNGHATAVATITGNNSYSGATNLFQVTVDAGSSNAFGDGQSDLDSIFASTVNTNGFNISFGSLTGDAQSVINVSTGSTLTVGGSDLNSNWAGTIAGVGGQMTVTGPSETILTGATTVSLITINSGGFLSIGNGSAPGATLTSDILNSGTLQLAPAPSELYLYGGVLSGTGTFNISPGASGGVTLTGTSNAYSGATNILGGALSDGGAGAFSPNSSVAISSGAFLDVNHAETVANLAGGYTGGVYLGLGADLASRGLNYASDFLGVIQGSGSFSIAAGGIQGLAGANTFTGGMDVGANAEVFIGNDSALGTGVVTFEGGSEFAPDASITVANNLVLNGTGWIDQDDGQNFNTTFTGQISGTNGIAWCTPGTLTLTNGGNTFAGGVDMREGSLVLAASNAAGSGGTIILDGGTRMTVQTGAVINNPLSINNSPNVLTGSGTIGGVVTANSSVVIDPQAFPGNGPGTLTFTSNLSLASGGAIHLDIFDATGAAGTGYSQINAAGGLNISAGANTITFNVVSTDASGNSANALHFSPTGSYSWTFATSPTAITGTFNPNEFVLVTSGFTNSLGGGQFSVSEVGNDLDLNFTPVPEPGTWAMMTAGVGGVGVFGRLRRRRAAA